MFSFEILHFPNRSRFPSLALDLATSPPPSLASPRALHSLAASLDTTTARDAGAAWRPRRQ
ncbi:hypothetical protein NQ318_005161 [Aromia moschata]|uniref:Uncharacterized protein n=1 Tax=Aromia moschata TaxID=1265417 RepID=A0AAV8XIX3_9CUCU|nr:hypothetical protein NQ318_005161 [Aromia moschata]